MYTHFYMYVIDQSNQSSPLEIQISTTAAGTISRVRTRIGIVQIDKVIYPSWFSESVTISAAALPVHWATERVCTHIYTTPSSYQFLSFFTVVRFRSSPVSPTRRHHSHLIYLSRAHVVFSGFGGVRRTKPDRNRPATTDGKVGHCS